MTLAELWEIMVVVSKIAWVVLILAIIVIVYTLKRMIEVYNEWYKEYGRDL